MNTSGISIKDNKIKMVFCQIKKPCEHKYNCYRLQIVMNIVYMYIFFPSTGIIS